MFILQHHLQYLTTGFKMSSKSSFPHNSRSPPPIPSESRHISSHTLIVATTKFTHHPRITATRSPPVDQGLVWANWMLTKQLSLWRKFEKMKQNILKISVLLCKLFILCLMILMWTLTTWSSTL